MGFTNGGGFAQAPAALTPSDLPNTATFKELTVTDTATISNLSASTETVTGTFSAPNMRFQNVNTDGAAAQNITSATYANLPSTQFTNIGITCPVSGVLAITFCLQYGVGSATATDFLAAAVVVTNITRSTTPFAASDTHSVAAFGTGLTVATLSRTVLATAVGNAGDSIAVTLQARSSKSGGYFVERTDLTVIPSP
ncbi:MAG TPA: hypothetical protein VN375_19275 [Vicinamibacteria bacterium]|jgi:hypothetical protein|nr:hypothetical protein [Vicinamibacteria bacterium]